MSDGQDMATGDGNDKPYEVGYGKPPKATQFKEGNKFGKKSKNPPKNLKTIVNEKANEKISVKLDGKVRKLTKQEVAMSQLVNQAAAGDLKAIGKLIELLALYGPQEEIREVSPEQAAYDLETISNYLTMNGLIGEDDEDDDSDA